MERPLFSCPQFGNTKLQQLGVKRDRSYTHFADDGHGESEPSTTFAFQCECGVAFTETVRERQRALGPAHENSRVNRLRRCE